MKRNVTRRPVTCGVNYTYHLLDPSHGRRPTVVVPGETSDTSNHRHNSSVEDRDAICGLGYRRRLAVMGFKLSPDAVDFFPVSGHCRGK